MTLTDTQRKALIKFLGKGYFLYPNGDDGLRGGIGLQTLVGAFAMRDSDIASALLKRLVEQRYCVVVMSPEGPADPAWQCAIMKSRDGTRAIKASATANGESFEEATVLATLTLLEKK